MAGCTRGRPADPATIALTTLPPKKPETAVEAVRALLFLSIFYPGLALWGLIFMIPAFFSHRMTVWTMKSYVVFAFWLLRVLCGTRCERRGPIPVGPCIVASKHQSFLDVMMLMLWLPEPRFVMKRSVMWMPVLGIYAVRLGCVPIDRGKRGEAMRSIISGVRHMRYPGQVIIFPQGTRVPPGEVRPYKGGVVKLSAETGQKVELAAANTGWFWPRTGLRRSPGTAVLEFIGPLPGGVPVDERLGEIESRIEHASDLLAEQAAEGFCKRRS